MLPIILAMEAEDQRSRMVEIYDHYGPFVYQCIGDYFQDFQRKEDLFQEVFKRLIERAEVVEILPHRQLRSYIWYTVRSVCCNLLQKEKGHRTESLETLWEEEGFEVAGDAPAVYETIEKEELSDQVSAAMGKLTARERDVLSYKYFMEMSDQEIAAAMGIAQSSVRVYLMRARNHLVKIWQREEHE